MNGLVKEKNNRIKELEKIAKYLRTSALNSIIMANNGHIGGNLSSVELLTALYFGGIFYFDPENDKNENRDRVLLRGHEGPIRYNIFSLLGYLKHEEMNHYRELGSRLPGHEDMFVTPGVDITPSGSLGMVLSYGVGACIANKDKNIDSKCIVFLGDGEEQEGNVSEAARHATKLGLDNLICVLDQNGKQLSGKTSVRDGNSDIRKIWEGYGFDVIEIENGNDISQVLNAYEIASYASKPILIIAHTIKGYGVKGALEHFSGYHTLSAAPNKELVKESLKELKEDLIKNNINYENTKKLAESLVSVPDNTYKKLQYIEKELYDIRTNQSGKSLEEAQEEYLMTLKNRILASDKKSNFVMVTPDLLKDPLVNELGFKEFSHYIDTGIKEQHAIAMCHGMSVTNPESRIYVYTCDAFAYRSIDQLNAAAQGKSNILIVGESAGIFQAQNGKTHQSVSQPAAILSIPGVNLYEPADSVDLFNVFSDSFVNNNGITYIRLHRGSTNIERNKEDLKNTGSYFIHKSDKEPKLVILSSGFMGENAVLAAKRLESEYNIPTNVINIVNLNSFEKYAPSLLSNEAPIITLYNGNPDVLTNLASNVILKDKDIPRPEFIYGHGFINGATGKIDDLIKYYNFDSEGVMNLCLKKVKK